MYNRRYDKKFFMLRQEQTGYSMGQKTPWGSSILEIKNNMGVLTTRVQGLRPLKNSSYDIYVFTKKEDVVFCNSVQVDSSGQGEMVWEFYPDFIYLEDNSKSVSIEDVVGILVVVSEKNDNFAPLVAYIDEKINWKKFFVPKKQKIDLRINSTEINEKIESIDVDVENNIEVIEKDIESENNTIQFENNIVKNEKQDFAREETVILASENAVADKPKIFNFNFNSSKNSEKYSSGEGENYHGNFAGLIKKFRQELKELADEGVFSKEDLKKIHNAGEIGIEKAEEKNKEKNEDFFKYLDDNNDVDEKAEVYQTPKDILNLDYFNNVENRLKNISKNFIGKSKIYDETKAKRFSSAFMDSKKVAPFGDENDLWSCITLDELILISSFPLEWQKKIFFLYPMKKYNHFLYKEIDGFDCLAVPSHKNYVDDDLEEAKDLGFFSFMPIENSDFGYWVCKKK